MHHLLAKGRAFAFVLVLEIHEGVVPVGGAFGDAINPGREMSRCVALVT